MSRGFLGFNVGVCVVFGRKRTFFGVNRHLRIRKISTLHKINAFVFRGGLVALHRCRIDRTLGSQSISNAIEAFGKLARSPADEISSRAARRHAWIRRRANS